MSDVKSLEEAVRSLSPEALAEFRRWFVAFDDGAWEARIESDLASRRLDALLAEAEAENAAGASRSL
jgi:hypothetical protein